ncbi:hypothetical protein EV702DRAFT_1205893 [Suillus placidus]|uniref:Uncharacterized protein n=1 Tax=Suillus placidus TaxID=48579 RepID=A0A9P6ZF58_9AGAM|nr:hypothetical protein EV702DRAFT_1205893 [Suillus placidus]
MPRGHYGRDEGSTSEFLAQLRRGEDLNEAKVFGPYNPTGWSGNAQTVISFDRASSHDTTFPPANAEELDTASLPNFDDFPTQTKRLKACALFASHTCDIPEAEYQQMPHYTDVSNTDLPAELFPKYTTISYALSRCAQVPSVFLYVIDTV